MLATAAGLRFTIVDYVFQFYSFHFYFDCLLAVGFCCITTSGKRVAVLRHHWGTMIFIYFFWSANSNFNIYKLHLNINCRSTQTMKKAVIYRLKNMVFRFILIKINNDLIIIVPVIYFLFLIVLWCDSHVSLLKLQFSLLFAWPILLSWYYIYYCCFLSPYVAANVVLSFHLSHFLIRWSEPTWKSLHQSARAMGWESSLTL